MLSTPKLRTIALLFVLPTLALAGPAEAASGRFEQKLAVDGAIVLDVKSGSGEVNISAGNTGEVRIRGRVTVSRRSFLGIFKRSSEDTRAMVREIEENPPIELVDGTVKVGRFSDRRYRKNVSVSYDIVVPASSEIISHTGSGSQAVSNVAGPVEAGTGSGRISLSNIGGPVRANSGSGPIRAENIAGAFVATAGSGSIWLTQVAPGDVKVRTGSGRILLHGVEGGLDVHAGSGRVEVTGRQRGAWRIDTGSGSVTATLPEDAAFEVDAHTGSGGIRIDHPVTVEGKISRRRIRGEVRGGGDLIAIETGSGGIEIR